MAKSLSMKEIKNQEAAQAQHRLNEAEQELQHLRSKTAMSDLKNVRQIRQTRQTIARLKTHLNSLS